MIEKGDRIIVVDYSPEYHISRESRFNEIGEVMGQRGTVLKCFSNRYRDLKVRLDNENENVLWGFNIDHVEKITELERNVEEVLDD